MKNERMAVQDDRERKMRSQERFAGAGSAPAFYIPRFYIQVSAFRPLHPGFHPRFCFTLSVIFFSVSGVSGFFIRLFGKRTPGLVFRLAVGVFYFPTQKWLKISATTSSLTSRPFV